MSFKTIEWKNSRLRLIDQTLLPVEEVTREYDDYREVAEAIKTMVVRGAPAIGVTAAYGVALGAQAAADRDVEGFRAEVLRVCEVLAGTRPTAVNLFWAIERMKGVLSSASGTASEIAGRLEREAALIHEEDVEANRAMGANGAALLPDECTVLTHCNAGALATADYGTALGVIRAAVEAGKKVTVVADETRPLLQGARLTAWELMKDSIPVTLITDNMAGYRMKTKGIDAIVVGADRIAANGDVANKIGTYSLSVLAKAHGVPFYVAAPMSTIDFSLGTGEDIPIEQRESWEVECLGGARVAPEGVEVWNPAFDVTPAENVSAIITDKGVARAPYGPGLDTLKK